MKLTYAGPLDAVELTHVDDQGRVERLEVRRGVPTDIPDELVKGLLVRDDFKKSTTKGAAT